MTDKLPGPAHGTDMRLDLILDELRGIRAALAPPASAEPEDGEPVALREPAKPEKPPKRRA
jgi:hypothetical protein